MLKRFTKIEGSVYHVLNVGLISCRHSIPLKSRGNKSVYLPVLSVETAFFSFQSIVHNDIKVFESDLCVVGTLNRNQHSAAALRKNYMNLYNIYVNKNGDARLFHIHFIVVLCCQIESHASSTHSSHRSDHGDKGRSARCACCIAEADK